MAYIDKPDPRKTSNSKYGSLLSIHYAASIGSSCFLSWSMRMEPGSEGEGGFPAWTHAFSHIARWVSTKIKASELKSSRAVAWSTSQRASGPRGGRPLEGPRLMLRVINTVAAEVRVNGWWCGVSRHSRLSIWHWDVVARAWQFSKNYAYSFFFN